MLKAGSHPLPYTPASAYTQQNSAHFHYRSAGHCKLSEPTGRRRPVSSWADLAAKATSSSTAVARRHFNGPPAAWVVAHCNTEKIDFPEQRELAETVRRTCALRRPPQMPPKVQPKQTSRARVGSPCGWHGVELRRPMAEAAKATGQSAAVRYPQRRCLPLVGASRQERAQRSDGSDLSIISRTCFLCMFDCNVVYT